MTRLESGPAATDRNWRLLQLLVFWGLGAYFFYDGLHGYPQKNFQAADQELRSLSDGKVNAEGLSAAPEKERVDQLLTMVNEGLRLAQPVDREKVYAELGQPTFTRPANPGFTREYFASRYGMASIEFDNGRIMKLDALGWKDWGKTRKDIDQQFYLGGLCMVGGLYFFWRLIQAMTLRVVIDDEGMTYARKRITFAAMTALRDYSPKGWIDLYHTATGRETRLRLDWEKVGKFKEIVAAICQAKGFSNPVAQFDAQKNAVAAEGPDEPPAK